MSDIIPDNSKRIAYTVGLVFHPAVIAVVTLLLLLRDLPLMQTLLWSSLISAIILIPIFIVIAFLRFRRNRHTYQRKTRGPLYSIAWLSVMTCLMLILVFEGPQELAVSMATLAVWLPLQLSINHYITKISAHTAVASGCFMALLLLSKLSSGLIVIAILMIIFIAWARLMTKNHTLLQVILGLTVGAGSVLTVFPLMLN
jgi:membrane-associated phospholipid phosphatase